MCSGRAGGGGSGKEPGSGNRFRVEPFLGTVFLEPVVLRGFRVPGIPFPRFRKSLCFEGILLYFESILLLHFETALLCFESILVYFESILLCFERIFLYFESILLYVESIHLYILLHSLHFESALLDVKYTFVLCKYTLYFATMLGQGRMVINVYFTNANLLAVGDTAYAYLHNIPLDPKNMTNEGSKL